MNMFLPPLRPPGALDEAQFRRLCIRCGRCLEVCPHHSLKISGGFGRGRLLPFVDPAASPCQLCMKCVAACPVGALDKNCDHLEKVKMGQAHIITTKCLNYTGGTMCWTCYDRCPLRGRAIILKDGLIPAMTDLCAGCGVCGHVCPHQAIAIVAKASSYKPLDAAPQAPRQ